MAGTSRARNNNNNKPKGDANLLDMQKLMMQHLLYLKLMSRTMCGIGLETVVIKSDSNVAANMMAEGKGYAAKCKGVGKGHTFGPPHVYVWGAMCAQLVAEGEKIGGTNLAVLKEHVMWLEVAGVEEKCEVISHCRIEKMYDNCLKKVTLALEARSSDGDARHGAVDSFTTAEEFAANILQVLKIH